MGLPFFKKHHKQEQVIPGKGFVPADRIREMAARGFSEPEMIDIMRRDGFSADEVDKALTQALRIGVTGESPRQPQQRFDRPNQPVYQRPQQQAQQRQQFQQNQQQGQQPFKWPSEQLQEQIPGQQQRPMEQQPLQRQAEYELPTLTSLGIEQKEEKRQGEGGREEGSSMPQIPETSLPEGYYSQQYASEDYIDYVVQQRVSEITEKIGEYQKRYQDLQAKIDELRTQLSTKESKSGPMQSQVMSKMDTFSDTVTDIDSRLSGLEKAFKETLPELISSVRTLSDLVQKVRKENASSSI